MKYTSHEQNFQLKNKAYFLIQLFIAHCKKKFQNGVQHCHNSDIALKHNFDVKQVLNGTIIVLLSTLLKGKLPQTTMWIGWVEIKQV